MLNRIILILCYFKRRVVMPEGKKCCENPEKLKGKPGECSSEQIEECHGDQPGHSCTDKND